MSAPDGEKALDGFVNVNMRAVFEDAFSEALEASEGVLGQDGFDLTVTVTAPDRLTVTARVAAPPSQRRVPWFFGASAGVQPVEEFQNV